MSGQREKRLMGLLLIKSVQRLQGKAMIKIVSFYYRGGETHELA